jgi:hypothetical protein
VKRAFQNVFNAMVSLLERSSSENARSRRAAARAERSKAFTSPVGLAWSRFTTACQPKRGEVLL